MDIDQLETELQKLNLKRQNLYEQMRALELEEKTIKIKMTEIKAQIANQQKIESSLTKSNRINFNLEENRSDSENEDYDHRTDGIPLCWDCRIHYADTSIDFCKEGLAIRCKESSHELRLCYKCFQKEYQKLQYEGRLYTR